MFFKSLLILNFAIFLSQEKKLVKKTFLFLHLCLCLVFCLVLCKYLLLESKFRIVLGKQMLGLNNFEICKFALGWKLIKWNKTNQLIARESSEKYEFFQTDFQVHCTVLYKFPVFSNISRFCKYLLIFKYFLILKIHPDFVDIS